MIKNAGIKVTSKVKGVLTIIVLIIIGVGIWKWERYTCDISCTAGGAIPTDMYSEQQSVINAMCLSYLVYGCEACDEIAGTVNELLDNKHMGILIENFGIKRKDKTKPDTALFDTSEFIRTYVGDYRVLTYIKNSGSSFYGAAFCDDEKKCVWIAYTGSISVQDAVACAQMVVAPRLSSQEKSAFELYEKVMESKEVTQMSYNVILTGHSLGGAFASMVSRVSGCTAITINGADGLAIDKINDILDETPEEYNIYNYLTDAQGQDYSIYNLVQRLMFLGSYKKVNYNLYKKNEYTDDAHSVFSFIEFTDDKFSEPILP